MSGSLVYSRKSVGGLWFCMFLVSTGFMHQQTLGATEVECLMHEDCKPGQFCAYVPNIDSYEGWRFATSTCKACSQCVCHFSSTTNRCPQERCPGTPTHRIHQLEGNFVSASQISDEDICLTSFTVRASFFRMVSTRVQRAVYDSAFPALPSYLYVSSSSPEPNLCDFPDAPGAKEGKMEILPDSPPEMTARAKLFYFHGLPLGTTRIVEFFDHCPFAMFARFTPIEMVKTIHPLPEIGLETRFYTFVSNGASRGYALRTYTKGETKFKFIVASTAPGQRELSGTYTGFFEYGTTRRSADDIGDIESILCNITFSFEVGLQGVVPWDQHTWGCGRRIPQVNGVPEPNYLKHLRHNTRDPPTISTLQKDINERRKVTGEGAPEGEAGNIGQASPLRIESQTSFRRQLIFGDDKHKAETCSKATPGSHVIYETTEAGLTALGVDFNSLFQTDSQWACANGGSTCCDVCAAGSYQPLEDNSQTCLSCPAYFTNNKRGSASLSECCAPQNGFGIYNARIQTSFNEFGILRHLSVLRNADKNTRPAVKELKIWQVSLFSTYYICSGQSPDPGLPPCTSEGSFSPPERAGLFQFPFQTPGSCCQVKKAESFNISMTPTFIPSNILYDKENAYDDQFGGDLCEEVVFTIQPMVGIDAVASLLELDFGCPNCFVDLGPNGSMKVSIFSVATQDIMPPELVLQATAPPKASKVRDPIYEGIRGNEAFSSRNWEESYTSKPNYEYDLEVLDLHRQIQDFFECNASTFNASKVEDEEIETKCFLPPKRLLLGPEFILNQTYSSYIGQDNQRYACEYEDPALGSSRYKPWPWLGIQLPRCQDDYKRRLRMQEDIVFKNFQNVSRKANQTNIHKIGIRIRARVTPGLKQDEPYAGFRFGYKWFNSEHVCHAGSFSRNGSNGGPPCFLCPAGKFTTVDGQLWSCFDCPRGMYAEKKGSTQCSLCPSGKSTTKRGANSTDECRYYCRAGSFSRFGVEPCTLCERGKTQSKVGAVYCEQCPQGFTTFERGFTGFNNTPWTCYDARGLTFELEEFRLVGSRFSIRVRWKLPADRLHVEDIIALFKGDPMTSKRQLTWSYASAASIDSDTTCWDVAYSGTQSACRNPGSVVRPWASISFNIDSAGPGTYSVVYFAQKSLFRAFTVSHPIRVLTTTDKDAMSLEKRAEVEQVCPNPEQDCCEMLDLRSNNNIQLICPRDLNHWETDTGMFTCRKGQYSSEDADLAPCLDCPLGTVSSSIGSTKCTACDQGFYANPLCSGQGQCPEVFSQAGVNLKPREKCIRCPDGKSTLTDKSELADCKPCSELFQLTSNDIPFCVDPRQQRTTTAVVVQTTPAPPKNCGNGIQIFPEQCDDNNTASSDGCSDECTIEQGWFCFQQDGKSASRCRAMVCGDGIREYSEQCDDGNLVPEDCCSQKCRIERGCRCAGDGFGRSRCETLPVCGDFVREWTKGETCDDGNLRPGDGCSSNCRQEANYSCRNNTFPEPELCCADLVLCGNGILDKCEECDDGNAENNDGCSNMCKVEDFYQCRDGCSGPLCQSEYKCKEPLIGRKPQVTLQQGSAIKGTGSGTVYKWGMGILTWLNISDTFSETVPVTIEENPRLKFDIPVALEVQSGVWPTKRIGGSNLVGYSTGLLLRMQQGPNEFSTLNMMTAKSDSDSIFASIQEMGFRGIYGRGGTTSQLACTFCSGLQNLQWPSGIISEPIGMMIKDKTCHFIVDGAVDLMWSMRQSSPFNAQDYQESTFRGVEITIHEIGFRSNDELLSVEVERSICDSTTGLKCSNVSNYTKVFRRGTTAPIKLQMKPPVRIGFVGKSHLLDLERNLPWDIPATSAVRFKLSYKSLRIGQAGESCCISCRYDPDCIQASACFAGATEVTIPNKRTHVIFDRLKKYVEQRSAQDVSAFRSRRAAFEYEEGEEESDAQEGESFWTLPHASGDSRTENSQQASITGSPQTETRRSESVVDKLTLVFDGAVGIELNSTDLPCAFAQSERQILTVVERQPDVWRGAEGAWDGKCYINPSCSAPEVIDDKSGVLKTRCSTGEQYFDPVNLCSIRIEISDRIIREYRYGCDGSATFTSTSADAKINGSAHGVIVSVGQQTLNEYSGADVRVLAYRRVEVVWTRSSLADRPVGVLFKGYLTFGESEELGAQGEMQIYWGRRDTIWCPLGACDPLLFFDKNAARFIPREGECRNMDLKVAKNVIITADNFLASGQGNNNLPDLLNLRQYLECNATFQQLQSLATSNFECKRVLDVLLFRDAETAVTNIDEKLCKSGCLSEVQNLLGSTVKTCSARWKEDQFSGVYANVLFKKLYIAATALAWSKVVCYVNQYEERCTRTINDYANLFGACSIFRTTHGLEATFVLNKSIHGLLKNGGQGQEVCPSACIEALIKYQNQDGCCAASVSEAASFWANSILADTREPFTVDLGETANPWTPLGAGTGNKVVNFNRHCTNSRFILTKGDSGDNAPTVQNTIYPIYPQCLMSTAEYCGNPSWRPPCCDFPCLNGGTKGWSGDCYCSCPLQYVGADCSQKKIYVRFSMEVFGEDKLSYHYGKQQYTQRALESVIASNALQEVQWDSIKEVKQRARRNLRQHAPSVNERDRGREGGRDGGMEGKKRAKEERRESEPGSVRVLLRFIYVSSREAARMQGMFLEDEGIWSKLQKQVAEETDRKWSAVLDIGEHPPLLIDANGLEVCDDMKVKCYLGKKNESTYIYQHDTKKEGSAGFNVDIKVLIPAVAALGGVLAALLIGVAALWWTKSEGYQKFRKRLHVASESLSGIMTSDFRKKRSSAKNRLQKTQEEEYKIGMTVQIVNTADNKMSKRGDPSGFLLHNFAAGQKNTVVSLSSSLVFQNDASTSGTSGDVPAHYQTAAAHAKLSIQGKGELIPDSEHSIFHVVKRDDFRPKFDRFHITQRSSVKFATLDEMEAMQQFYNPTCKPKGAVVFRNSCEGGGGKNIKESNPLKALQRPKLDLLKEGAPVAAVVGEDDSPEKPFYDDDAAFKREQILKSLRSVKQKQGGTFSAPTSLSQPRLLSNPDKNYLVLDGYNSKTSCSKPLVDRHQGEGESSPRTRANSVDRDRYRT